MSSRRRSGRSTNLVVPLYTAHRLGELPQKRYDRVKVIGEGVAGVLYFVKVGEMAFSLYRLTRCLFSSLLLLESKC